MENPAIIIAEDVNDSQRVTFRGIDKMGVISSFECTTFMTFIILRNCWINCFGELDGARSETRIT